MRIVLVYVGRFWTFGVTRILRRVGLLSSTFIRHGSLSLLVSLGPLSSWPPHTLPDILSLLAPLGSLSAEALPLSLSILFTLLVLGLRVSRMARRLLFQRPFDAS